MATSTNSKPASKLTSRDAIHMDDVQRYDKYMDTVQDRHAIDMYMQGKQVKVDFYDGRTNTFEKSESFKASDVAEAHFAYLDNRARQVLGKQYTG